MSNQPEAMLLADELDWRHEVDPINIKAATELRRLHAEVSRLQAWHQTAWQRGHAVGLSGLNEALRQMEDHKKSDAWGNTQLTEALMRAEEQRDELLEALRNIVNLWDHHASAHGDGIIYPLHGAARAAIAKVEGRA
jgi:hypothetical protein